MLRWENKSKLAIDQHLVKEKEMYKNSKLNLENLNISVEPVVFSVSRSLKKNAAIKIPASFAPSGTYCGNS